MAKHRKKPATVSSLVSLPRTSIAAVGGASLFGAFLVLILAHPLDHERTQLVSNLSLVVAPILSAAGAALAARSSIGRARRAWTLIALAALSWGAGQAYWTYAEEVAGIAVPFPSWADVGYLALIPFALAGLSYFSSQDSSNKIRARTIVDGLLIACSLFFVSWLIILQMLFANEDGFALAIALSYPAGDVLLATWVITLGARVRPEARARWWLLGAGVLAFAFSDSAFAYATALDLYSTGSFIDLGWFAGFLLIGIAGVVASTAEDDTPLLQARATSSSMFVPYLPFCVALVFLSGQQAGGTMLDAVQFWSLLVLGLLVILRQLLSMLENGVLTKRLESANARLNESETARVRLLNTITHDLLNPLTPIRLQLTLLQKVPPGLDARQARAVDTIERNVGLLHRLVLDVKDLARLEHGKLSLLPERIEVAQLIDLAIETFSPLAESRGLRLRTERGSGLYVNADRERMTQVMFNLVSNAIKFTPAGGEIVVGFSDDGKGPRLWVRDSGRGLTQEEISRLFKPFSQVHKPGETQERGTGLGLFLSREIVEQHGGALWVESPGLRRGSTFFLSLPRVA